MATTVLLRGECAIWKNNVPLGKIVADFSYDNDLRFFKLISVGNIKASFKPEQIKGFGLVQTGSVFKKWQLSIMAKWSSGDEFTYSYLLPTKEHAERIKANIQGITMNSRRQEEVLALLRTRERVSKEDVASLLSKFNAEVTDQTVQDFVQGAITSGQIEGVYDGKEYLSKYALQRETVRYDIVSKFEVGSSGAIVITCPKCGAAIPIETKESNGKCRFCGSPYVVPRKILDLV